MASGTSAHASLRQRGLHELKELAILTGYFYVTLGSVILLKAAVLHDQGISYTPWGVAIVKALVLAKFMLVGHAMKIGGGSSSRPLIWPTLYQVFAFLILLIVLTCVEEVVVGLIHSRSVADSLGDLFGAKLNETLANILVMMLILTPYCAIRVLSEALGEGRLVRMFFIQR